MIGDGPLRNEIEKKSALLGIADKVIFGGLRKDVDRIMLGAMDVFVMPSLYEGLPVVGIEAQAAGLPCIMSDVVTDELEAGENPIHWIDHRASPDVWSNTIIKAVEHRKKTHNVNSLVGTQFDINMAAKELCDLYINSAIKKDCY